MINISAMTTGRTKIKPPIQTLSETVRVRMSKTEAMRRRSKKTADFKAKMNDSGSKERAAKFMT